MPRFGLKSLLIVFALVAVWCSTLRDFAGAQDVRAFVMIAIFVASGVAAYAYEGRWRAFWMGVFGTQFVMGSRQFFTLFGARFDWALRLIRDWANDPMQPRARGTYILGVHMTLIYGATLIVAALIGLLCVYVYDQAKRNKGDEADPR